METIADVIESLRLVVGTVSLRREMIHHALAVGVPFVGPEPPGSDAADDGVQVIPPGLTVVLQQAAALQIADGVGRKVGIERAQRGVIHGFGQEREDREDLSALLRNSVKGGFEDVVALLDEVEVGEIELAAAGWVGRPGVEITPGREGSR